MKRIAVLLIALMLITSLLAFAGSAMLHTPGKQLSRGRGIPILKIENAEFSALLQRGRSSPILKIENAEFSALLQRGRNQPILIADPFLAPC